MKKNRRKIIDTFIFFNETDILDLRLSLLHDHVDKFVIIESKKTFTNKDKELNFYKQKEKYKKYLNKIVYIVCDSFPTDLTAPESRFNTPEFKRELYQRDFCIPKLKMLGLNDHDIVLVGDVDEIVLPDSLKKIPLDLSNEIVALTNIHLTTLPTWTLAKHY